MIPSPMMPGLMPFTLMNSVQALESLMARTPQLPVLSIRSALRVMNSVTPLSTQSVALSMRMFAARNALLSPSAASLTMPFLQCRSASLMRCGVEHVDLAGRLVEHLALGRRHARRLQDARRVRRIGGGQFCPPPNGSCGRSGSPAPQRGAPGVIFRQRLVAAQVAISGIGGSS